MPPSFACVPSQSHLNINPAAVTSPTTSSPTATTTDVSNVYQVDYTCVNAGKTLGMTKRRVRFRFGFADTQALLSGEKAGADCRGEEHEIIINWSLASGKQQVLCDGHEIFYEVRPRESVLTCAWRFRGNHVLKVVGYAKPSTMRQAGTKQFNIFLDEVSFYDFLPIYAIGTRPSSSTSYYPEKNYRPVVSHSNREQYNIDTEGANEYYDEKGLQYQHQAVTTPSTVASFQSYEGESGEPNNNNNNSNYADLLDMADDSVVYYNTTVPPSQQQQQQLPVNDPFSYPPANVEVDPENERRSKLAEINQQLTMAIQNTHISAAPPPTNTTHAIVPSQTQSSYYASEAYSTNASYPSQEPAPASVPVPVLLDENQDTSNTEEKSGDNAFDDMMKKLVNVEDITSEPEHLQNSKLSMKPLLEKKKNASNKQQQESYGPQPTLSQLKAVSSLTVKGPDNNKEIMKPSNYLPNNNNVSYQGALVVHGASSPHYNPHPHAHQDMNSAPPLMRQVGFGVGASYQQQYGQAPQQAYYARSG